MRFALTDDDLEVRRLTVASYFLIWEARDDDSWSLREQLTLRRQELREKYLSVLPRVALSRCPFTDDIVERSIDLVDLDGLFWEARNPARALEPHPPTMIGMAGATALGEPVAWAPFLAKPGPEVPFVRPDILDRPGVVAVVSQVSIGPHTGYAISYFLDPSAGPVPEELRINEWGSERFEVIGGDGAVTFGAELDDENSYDYELSRWLDEGRLRWIAPGDPSLRIRFGTDGCPFLDLTGHRSVTRIEEGDVWWPEDVGTTAPSSFGTAGATAREPTS